MPGLLGNGWDDPQSQAILALSGGLLRGDFGGGLLGANQAYGHAQDSIAKKQYMQMQMQNLQSEVETRKAALAKQQQLLSLFGGAPAPSAPAQPGQLGSGSFGVVPPPAGAPAIPQAAPQGGSRVTGMSIDQLAQAKMLGLDLTDLYKLGTEGVERKPGSFYDIPGKGREFIPDVKSGMNYQSGQISAIPGYNNFLTQQTLATEGPKAILNSAGRVNLRKNADGTESPIPELNENPTLQRLLGGGAFGQSAPTAIPSPGAPGRPMVSPGDQKARDAEAIQIVQSELNQPNLPPDQRAGLERELARLQGSQQQAGFPTPSLVRTGAPRYGQTDEQKAGDEATRKMNDSFISNRYQPVLTAGDAAGDMLTNVSVARNSMRAMGGTGWGTEAKALGASVLAGLGIAPENAKLFAANAETFQNAAMTNLSTQLNAAKGPQTEGDAARVSKTFAQLKNTPQANEFILDLTEAKALRDQMKADFFREAYDVARKKGDLTLIEREWAKRAPSVFSIGSMQKWAK